MARKLTVAFCTSTTSATAQALHQCRRTSHCLCPTQLQRLGKISSQTPPPTLSPKKQCKTSRWLQNQLCIPTSETGQIASVATGIETVNASLDMKGTMNTRATTAMAVGEMIETAIATGSEIETADATMTGDTSAEMIEEAHLEGTARLATSIREVVVHTAMAWAAFLVVGVGVTMMA